MKSAGLPLIVVVMASSLAAASAASEPSAPAAQPAQQETEQSSPEYKAIDDQARKYEEAYNKGEAKALASFYAEDVDYIDQDGAEVKGRDAIEKLLADNFQANPGAKLAITIDDARKLTPDVLVERGVANVTAADGTAEATRYVAIHVKKGIYGRFPN